MYLHGNYLILISCCHCDIRLLPSMPRHHHDITCQLTPQERLAVAKRVHNKAAGRVPVVAGGNGCVCARCHLSSIANVLFSNLSLPIPPLFPEILIVINPYFSLRTRMRAHTYTHARARTYTHTRSFICSFSHTQAHSVVQWRNKQISFERCQRTVKPSSLSSTN